MGRLDGFCCCTILPTLHCSISLSITFLAARSRWTKLLLERYFIPAAICWLNDSSRRAEGGGYFPGLYGLRQCMGMYDDRETLTQSLITLTCSWFPGSSADLHASLALKLSWAGWEVNTCSHLLNPLISEQTK